MTTTPASIERNVSAVALRLGVTKAQLLANRPLLTQVLTYHVVPGYVPQAQVPVNTPIGTVQGQTFTVSPTFVITDQRGRTSNIVVTDVRASNGVIKSGYTINLADTGTSPANVVADCNGTMSRTGYYATAALAASGVCLAFSQSGHPRLALVAGMLVATTLRLVSLRFGWRLPVKRTGPRS